MSHAHPGVFDLIGLRVANWASTRYARLRACGTPPPTIEYGDSRVVGIHKGRPLVGLAHFSLAGRLLAVDRAPRPGVGFDLVLARGGMSLPGAASMWRWWLEYPTKDGEALLNWSARYGNPQPDMEQVEWLETVGAAPPSWIEPGKKIELFGRLCERSADEDDRRLLILADHWRAG